MKPIPAEVRAEVLAACDANDGTRIVAVRFKVSESWVRRIKQRRRETGQVAPQTTPPQEPKWKDLGRVVDREGGGSPRHLSARVAGRPPSRAW